MFEDTNNPVYELMMHDLQLV